MKNSILASVSLILFLCHPEFANGGKNLEQLEEELQGLSTAIQENRKIYGTKSIKKIKELSLQFDKLEYDQAIWEAAINNRNKEKQVIDVWLHQSSKDAIGGFLFYPPETEDLKYTPYQESLLERNDMIWSFASSAKYNDPRGQYYLSYSLNKVWGNYNGENKIPQFYKKLASNALEGLKANTADETRANPEALYILGYEYANSSKGLFKQYDLSKAENYLTKVCNSPRATLTEKGRSQTMLFNLKSSFRGYYKDNPEPIFEDYLKIAENTNFGQALEDGLKDGKNPARLEEMLQQAAEKYKYYSAYITLGLIKKSQEKNENAMAYFNKAASHLPHGHIQLGNAYLGVDIIDKEVENLGGRFQNLSKEAIQKAEGHYLAAAEKGDLEGWNYLMAMYRGLYALKKEKAYFSKFSEILEHGLEMGSVYAYDWLEGLYSSKRATIQEKVEKYGKAPHKDLWKDIKSFIEPTKLN